MRQYEYLGKLYPGNKSKNRVPFWSQKYDHISAKNYGAGSKALIAQEHRFITCVTSQKNRIVGGAEQILFSQTEKENSYQMPRETYPYG